ncbi:cytosolic carboxypeptidase 1-like [Pitangus sulphuratus]|nr:cytosolic carboxypeptidase 1-like [Pitangus sulphuratus]
MSLNFGAISSFLKQRQNEELRKDEYKGKCQERQDFMTNEDFRRCSNSSLESDDEPPCVEDIDYNTDSISDCEEDFSELDQEIQESLSWVEGEREDEGVTTGQTCSTRALRGLYISSQTAPNSTALPLGSTALGLYNGFKSNPV